jgi:hypothetical protein
MPFGFQNAQGDVALTLTAQAAGTVQSGAVSASGQAAYVLLCVHVSAISGTPTLNTSLEESDTGTGSWTAVAGSSTAQLSAAGNAVAFAKPTKSYVRVTATVAGTTPSVTATAAVLVFAE